MKWFRIYGEKWFMGSTRWELSIEQRAIWVDILARASINDPPGQIEFYSLEQLAQQFNVSLELLGNTIKRCEEVKKIKHFPKERKILIIKWKKYQSEYERQKPYRKQDRCQSKVTKVTDNFSNKVTLRKEGEEKRSKIKKMENREDGKRKESLSPNKNSSNSPLPSNSNSFTEEGKTVKDQFLSMLKGCNGYPFDEFQDSLLFDITVKDCPSINIIKQTEKKIAWWQDHADALKANPREKLREWFKKELKFQKRGGPQKVGEIMQGVDDPDQRRWLEGFIKERQKKES